MLVITLLLWAQTLVRPSQIANHAEDVRISKDDTRPGTLIRQTQIVPTPFTSQGVTGLPDGLSCHLEFMSIIQPSADRSTLNEQSNYLITMCVTPN